MTFGLWALEALFVAEKNIVVNENDRKFVEEDSCFHLTYQRLISDDLYSGGKNKPATCL